MTTTAVALDINLF